MRAPKPSLVIRTKRPPKPPTRVGSKLPAPGTKLPLTVEVTRTGRNAHDTADTVTVRIPGYDYPVTLSARALGLED